MNCGCQEQFTWKYSEIKYVKLIDLVIFLIKYLKISPNSGKNIFNP